MGPTTQATLVCLLVTSALLPLVIAILRGRAMLDHPNTRSSHAVPVPRGAGLALGIGISVALLSTRTGTAAAWIAVLGFTTLGSWEDASPLTVRRRLTLQTAIATGTAFLLSASGSATWAWVPFVVVAVIASVNAVNFMDGINGITGMHAVLWGLVYCYLLWLGPVMFFMPLAGALAASGLSFLPWNAWRARAFLGDSGSYLVGAVVGLLAALVFVSGLALAAAAPLAIYAFDTCVTLTRRLARGESIGQAHHEHIYQRALDSGLGHVRVALSTVSLSALCALMGVLTIGRGLGVHLLSVLGIGAACLLYAQLPTIFGRWARRGE